MKQLSHKTIEDFLAVITSAEPKKKKFGDVFNCLVKHKNLILEKSPPDRAFFSYRPNPDYSVFLESSEGAFKAFDGSVKLCEIGFFKKYQINPRTSPLLATDNLERLFSDAFVFRSDVKSISSALEKVGFAYSSNNLVGEFQIGHYSTYVVVDLREIDKSINITMKVRPV